MFSALSVKNYRSVLNCCFLSVIAGCAVIHNEEKKTTPDIDTLIIVNKTNSTLNNVKLKDFDTQTYVTCSAILPQSECSLGFKRINAEQHMAILNWHQGSNVYSHKVEARNSIPTNEALKVYVDIYDDGKLETHFRKR